MTQRAAREKAQRSEVQHTQQSEQAEPPNHTTLLESGAQLDSADRNPSILATPAAVSEPAPNAISQTSGQPQSRANTEPATSGTTKSDSALNLISKPDPHSDNYFALDAHSGEMLRTTDNKPVNLDHRQQGGRESRTKSR